MSNQSESACVIAESVLPNKRTICGDKSPRSAKRTLVTKSSKTSGVGLTSAEKGLTPYWNEFCAEASPKLWLPTVTDWHDSASILSSGSVFGPEHGSWYSTEQLRNPKPSCAQIWCQSLPSSPAGSKVVVATCRKIRIFPTAAQRQILKQWFGAARYSYNQAITHLKTPETKVNWKGIKTPLVHALPEWANNVPYQVKSVAIRDACQAVSNAKRKCKKTKKSQFVRYRNRYRKQNIFIPKSAVSSKGVYHTVLGQLELAEKLPLNPRDSRLTLERGEYYLSVPYETEIALDPKPEGLAALDPGGRMFLSVYSPNRVANIGAGAFGRIFRLCQHLDKLVGRVAKKPPNRRRLKAAEDRIRSRIHNLINELHHQSAAWLTKTFTHIAMPDFNWHSVASGKLRSKTVRGLATFAHGRFREILKHHCTKRGTVLGSGSEAYTSKTDPRSGQIKKIGSAKMIKLSDGKTYLRDNVGALGIFLRALSDATWDWASPKPCKNQRSLLITF